MLAHGHHVVAVAALVIQGDRVLAMRRAATKLPGPGLWETISGRVEHGEEPLAAVIREIAEESGLHVEVEPRPFAAYASTRGADPMIVIAFRARHLTGEVTISDEHDAHAWCTASEFGERSTLAPLVAVVERALRDPW
ncbi:MAG: NUDIX domain-containing protein [Polyangiales bacterium]